MIRRLPAQSALLAIALLLPRVALAGLNPAATAALYWQTENLVGLSGPLTTSSTPQLVVTLKGVTNFRGADVQIVVSEVGCGGSPPLSPAWDFTSGGCNSGSSGEPAEIVATSMAKDS